MTDAPFPRFAAITIAEQCDRGKVREENQDSIRNLRTPLGELLIVADGIGGYQGGATASRMAVDCFSSYLAGLPAESPPAQAIREASARANAEIVAAANAPGSPIQRMGSTVVLALVRQKAATTVPRDPAQSQGQVQAQFEAWIGHIGDSRAYLFRDGRLSRLTNDHSAVQALLNRNLITPEEARHHPDASVLTRSLGHHPQVEIDIEAVELATGDTLLLCTDGLWGYIDEQQIESILANPALTADAASRALLELALDAGGPDNIGIELARLSLPSPTSTPSHASRFRFMRILAICLLVLATLGVLVPIGLRHHWLHRLRCLRQASQRMTLF
jgi:PPM family protein phosphatase